MLKYYLFYTLSIALGAAGQIILKTGAKSGKNLGIIHSFVNVFTISGYILLFITTLLSLYALKMIPLKNTIAFLPVTFIIVLMLSSIILKEKISKKQLLGSIIIIFGIIWFNFKW
jgi:drug/metabolite transporter (DMT)-like permease